MKKKILMATPYYYPMAGGLEQYVRYTSRSLAGHGWEVVIVTSGTGRSTQKEVIDDLVVYRLPRQFKLSNTPLSFRWRHQVKQLIRQEKPSVINAHAPVPGMAGAVLSARGNIPGVLTYHAGTMRKHTHSISEAFIMAYEKFLLPKLIRSADALICTSPYTKSFLSSIVPASTIITTATDPQLFFPAPRLPVKPYFGFLGGLKSAEAHKGLSDALKALKIVCETAPDAHLTIIGDGDRQAWYEREAHRLGLGNNVTFTGRLPSEEVAEVLRHQRGFLVTYTQDSLPTVIFEALASGLPLVTTDVGNITDVISKENGFLLRSGDVEGCAQALLKLIYDNRLAQNMGKANRTKGLEVTWQKQASKLEFELLKVMGKKA